MDLNLDSPSPVALTALPKLCPFKLANGSICQSPKTFARGYCEKHYRSLRRAGAFTDLTPRSLTPEATVLENMRAVRKARKALANHSPEIVDLFMAGAKNAAVKGDTAPMQWALLHTRVLQPVNTAPASDSTKGLTVNIGVKVSGTESK